ncbi:MAG: ethanolamine ammonia-lyase subunit EutC [Actinomycetia bacterium]|nr:ethanolamine ammonia-lyase subunit EutC [Actinomycetes bacterium]
MNEDDIARLVREVLADITARNAVPADAASPGEGDEAPDVTAVTTRDEFHVPHPANREGYLAMKQSTVARLGVWRAGPRYNTYSMLHFRADHATAQDAVFTDVDPGWVTGQGFIAGQSLCHSKDEFLTRPDLGRKLNDETRDLFRRELTRSTVTIMVGDGLSSSAMVNVPEILPAVKQGLQGFGIEAGPVAYVKYCRVGAMDDVGQLIGSDVVLLLIGERPGLATGESMSAYMAYQPRPDRPESWRTVVSNIYRGGTPPAEAGAHIATLLKRMLDEKISGVDLKL